MIDTKIIILFHSQLNIQCHLFLLICATNKIIPTKLQPIDNPTKRPIVNCPKLLISSSQKSSKC